MTLPTSIPTPVLQRAAGRAQVVLGVREGRTHLVDLHQSGSAKAFLPRVHVDEPEVVFLNTAGGLTGGDRLDFSLTLAEGAEAVATTQTAERAYASTGDDAVMEVALTLGQGARLHWLPQETILFDRSRLSRRTVAEIGEGAELLLVETVVLGRVARGEVITELALSDWREVRRGGKPVLVDPLGMTAAALHRPALVNGARAFSTLALVAPRAEDVLEPLRRVLPEGMEAAASAWDGRCVVRMMSDDPLRLRRVVARAIELLRGGPVPRVWQM